MSVVTPILDTLLHQVLGRRAGAPRPPLDAPPLPTLPGREPSAPRSDSRRDPRPALPDTGTLPGKGTAPSTGKDGAAAAVPGKAPLAATPPGAAATHLSPAARTIADILARFPAPPSAVRPSAPLRPPADSDPLPLAAALRHSVESSGLFYEAHLRRWRGGDFPRARLADEPQMRLPTLPGGGPVHPDLAGVLRHQLEMLATPVLRWEGEPWAGLLLALALQPPLRPLHDESQPRGGPHRDADADAAWQTQLRLQLPRLGNVAVALTLGERHLSLALSAAPAAVERLRAGSEALRQRLGALGFRRVQVHIGVHHNPGPGHG